MQMLVIPVVHVKGFPRPGDIPDTDVVEIETPDRAMFLQLLEDVGSYWGLAVAPPGYRTPLDYGLSIAGMGGAFER